jgi:predicted GIY-YIG superfamily endonuclease
MLRCADNTLDVGHTRNVTERERVHNAEEGPGIHRRSTSGSSRLFRVLRLQAERRSS